MVRRPIVAAGIVVGRQEPSTMPWNVVFAIPPSVPARAILGDGSAVVRRSDPIVAMRFPCGTSLASFGANF